VGPDPRPPAPGGTGGRGGADRPRRSGRDVRGVGTLFELAFTFAGTLLAGMAVGYYGGRWLDRGLGTDPWLQLLGLLLGVVAAFRVLWRTLQRQVEDDPAPRQGSGGKGGPPS